MCLSQAFHQLEPVPIPKSGLGGSIAGWPRSSGTIGERTSPLDAWNAEVIYVMGNVDHVVTTARLTGERRGIRVRMDRAHVFPFDGDSRIVEAWGFVADKAALASSFAAERRRHPGGGCFMPPISS